MTRLKLSVRIEPRNPTLTRLLVSLTMFTPTDKGFGAPGVMIAGVGPLMTETAAEVGNKNDLPELLPCPVNPQTGRLDLDYLLTELKTKHDIHSVMVEGGAGVLTAFYRRPDLVDCLCITIDITD